ncbi:MAG TPA: MASE1 domain-containing protein [Caulobacteraceae bacterium]|nr:MASE1 domain-containing protein [Caulobacteraceae bacterium]
MTFTLRTLARAAQALALWLGFTASVAVSLGLSRHGDPGAALWTGTGFLAGALIILPTTWRAGFTVACAATQIVIAVWLRDPLPGALAFTAANVAVAWATALLALGFCGVRARRLSLVRLARLLVLAIIPTSVSGAVIAACVGAFMFGRDFGQVWQGWMMSGGVGMAIVLPAVLLVARFPQYREFHRSAYEILGLFAALAAVTVGVFSQNDLPLLFAIYPLITLIAFRLGPPGAAVAAFLVGSIGLPLTLLGFGPAMLATKIDFTVRIQLAQAFVLICLFSGVATAAAFADQARLRRLMIWRDRAARAARSRAQAAERDVERIRRDRDSPVEERQKAPLA